MIERRTITRQLFVDAPLEACQPFVFEPALVREWFADVAGTLAAGEAFRFEFGDGDWFAGVVQASDPPHRLCLTWRFMDVGTESAIELHLRSAAEAGATGTAGNAGNPVGARTEVRVIDTGEHTEAGVVELSEGWDDFLGRLKQRIETGRPSRYRWSETIGAGALFAIDPEGARRRLLQARVWSAAFPTATVSLDAVIDPPVLRLTDPAWAGLPTEATLRIAPRGAGSALAVVHGGWLALPVDRQIAERRRYAGLWAAVLARLEADLGRADASAIAQCRRSARAAHSLP